MKTKYLFFSVLFVFIVWGIVACKDDDGLDMPVELTIGGNQTTFEFPGNGWRTKTGNEIQLSLGCGNVSIGRQCMV